MSSGSFRIICAGLLMFIVLISSTGLMSAAVEAQPEPVLPPPENTEAASEPAETAPPAAREETARIWMRMVFVTRAPSIRLCRPDGVLLQTLTPNRQDQAASDLMEPGEYLAVTEDCRTHFYLRENASVEVLRGDGWSDGELLYLSREPMGTVTVTRPVSREGLESAGGWLEYTLISQGNILRKVLRCDSPGTYTVTFTGVPYGRYELYENEVGVREMNLRVEERDIRIRLPEL